MATDAVEFILRARDESSSAIRGAQRGIDGLTGAVGNLSAKFGLIGAIGASVVGTVGGLVAAGKAIADTVEQLDLLAARTGVSIENLQVFHQVITDAGGSPEALTTALGFLNRAIAKGDPLLAQLGITTKDTNEAFTQLIAILDSSSDTAKKTEVAFRLMGRGSGDLLGVTHQLATATEATRAELEKTNALITGQSAQAARELDAKLDSLAKQWKGLAVSFQTLAVPAAAAMVEFFSAIIKNVVELGRKFDDFEKKRRRFITGMSDEEFEAALKRQRGEFEGFEGGKSRGVGGGGKFEAPVFHTAPTEEEAKRVTAAMKAELAARLAAVKLAKEDEVEAEKRALEAIAKARQKRLAALQAALGIAKVSADALLTSLEAIEGKEKREKLAREALEKLSPGSFNKPDFPSDLAISLAQGAASAEEMLDADERLNAVLALTNAQLDAMVAGLAKTTEGMDASQRASLEQTVVLEEWRLAIDDMLSSAAVLNEGLGAVYAGLQSGFATVFANLTTGAQSLRSALKTIFNALVSEILASLARLAAAKVFSLILSFFNPAAAAAPMFLPGGAMKAGRPRTEGGGAIEPEVDWPDVPGEVRRPKVQPTVAFPPVPDALLRPRIEPTLALPPLPDDLLRPEIAASLVVPPLPDEMLHPRIAPSVAFDLPDEALRPTIEPRFAFPPLPDDFLRPAVEPSVTFSPLPDTVTRPQFLPRFLIPDDVLHPTLLPRILWPPISADILRPEIEPAMSLDIPDSILRPRIAPELEMPGVPDIVPSLDWPRIPDSILRPRVAPQVAFQPLPDDLTHPVIMPAFAIPDDLSSPAVTPLVAWPAIPDSVLRPHVEPSLSLAIPEAVLHPMLDARIDAALPDDVLRPAIAPRFDVALPAEMLRPLISPVLDIALPADLLRPRIEPVLDFGRLFATPAIATSLASNQPPATERPINITVVGHDERSILRSLSAPNGPLRLALEDASLRG